MSDSPYTAPEYTTVVELPAPGGKLHLLRVEVLRATEHEEWIEGYGGRRIVIRPVLRVTTWKTYDTTDYVTLRGRRYSIDEVRVLYRYADRAPYFSYDVRDHYGKGIASDALKPLSYNSGAYETLRDLADEAANKYARENPGWEDLSRRRRLLSEIETAERKAGDARDKAASYDTKAATLRNELDALDIIRAGK